MRRGAPSQDAGKTWFLRGRVEDRCERILRIVHEYGSVRIDELARVVGISLEALCHDVIALGASAIVASACRLAHPRPAPDCDWAAWPPLRRSARRAMISASPVRERESERIIEDFERDVGRLLLLVVAGEVRAGLVDSGGEAGSLLQRLLSHGILGPEEFALVSSCRLSSALVG